ncbi:MAG: site-specific integrase [Clostridiales bacterium]|nr:site-specific integrase [Clostridiales bacterium]
MARHGRGEGSIFRSKDGLWSAEVSLGYGPDGKRRRVTLYGKTKREVQEKLPKLQQDALQGLPVKPERLKVQQHFEDWLTAKKRQVRPGTWLFYEACVRKHIIPVFGSLLLRDVDYRQMNAFYTQLQEKGLSPRTVHHIAGILRSALEDAVVKGLIPRNPAKLLPKPAFQRQEARFLTPEELRWFLEAVKGERLEAGFIVALHTGMRPGEWLGLPWDAVDLAKGTVSIRQALHEENGRVYIGPVKTKAALRTITLPHEAVEALRTHRKRQAAERLAAGAAWQDSRACVHQHARRAVAAQQR